MNENIAAFDIELSVADLADLADLATAVPRDAVRGDRYREALMKVLKG